MKAQFVSENINFQRGGNPLGTMDLGGFSYETLRPGAILQSKKFFGITGSSGQITGYHSGKMSVRAGDYFLVTHIGVPYGPKDSQKTIQFRKSSNLKVINELRDAMKEGKSPWASWSAPSGFLEGITKRRFDYRFDIIESGFPVNEGVHFHRTGDPKKTLKIGQRKWANVRPGDILIPKQAFKITKNGTFKPPSSGGNIYFDEEYPLIVYKIREGAVPSSSGPSARIENGYVIHYIIAWDMDEAKIFSSEIRNGTFEAPTHLRRPIQATERALERRLEIYEG